MFHTLQEFYNTWKHESASTISLFEKLTDESLDHKIYAEGRTMARLANHIIESLSELPSKLQLGIEEEHPDFHTAAELIQSYKQASDQSRECYQIKMDRCQPPGKKQYVWAGMEKCLFIMGTGWAPDTSPRTNDRTDAAGRAQNPRIIRSCQRRMGSDGDEAT